LLLHSATQNSSVNVVSGILGSELLKEASFSILKTTDATSLNLKDIISARQIRDFVRTDGVTGDFE